MDIVALVGYENSSQGHDSPPSASMIARIFRSAGLWAGAFLVRYVIWTPILLCALYFNDPWKYLGWFFAVIIGIDLVSSLVSLIPRIRKTHAMGVLWIVVISAFYLHTSWHSDPNSEMGSFKPEVTSEARGYYDLLAQNLAKGQLDLGIYCNDMNWCPDPYDITKRKYGWYLTDTCYYQGKYYLYFGITPVLTVILPFYVITGKFLPSPITIWIFCTLAFAFSAGIVQALIRIARKDASQNPKGFEVPNSVSENFIHITFISLGMGGFLPFILNKPHIYEIAQASGLAFSMMGIYFLLVGWLQSRSRLSYLWFALSGLCLAMAVGGRPTCIFCAIIAGAGFLQIFIQKKLRVLHVVSFLIPYGLYGAMLAYYNYLRFDSYFEFGYHYLLNDYPFDITWFKTIFGIRNYFIMPPALHEDYPYITLLWDWWIPANAKSVYNYIAAPAIGAFWICPITLFSACILFYKNKIDTWKFLIAMLIVSILLLTAVSRISQDARYIVDFIYYLIIISIFLFSILIQKKSLWIKIVVMELCIMSAFCSSAVSYFESRPGNELFKGDEGTLEDKISHFEKYKELFPKSVSTYFVLGAFYAQKRDYDKSLYNYNKCAELDPSFHEVQDRINAAIKMRKNLGLDMDLITPFTTGK